MVVSSKWPLSFTFPHQIPVCTSSPCMSYIKTNLIFRDLISQTVLHEEYRSGSSSLCSLLQCPVTSSLLSPTIFLSALFSNTLGLFSALNVRSSFKVNMKQWSELQFSVYLSFPPPHKKCIRQDSGLNGSKHPPYLICSYFTVMCKFGSLVSFPNELCLTLEWSNTRPVYTALTSSLLDFFNCIAVCKVTGNVT